MSEVMAPPVAVSQATFSPKIDPLCTTTGQVIYDELNPWQQKELSKKELTDWLEQNGHFKEAWKITACGHSFVKLMCPNGHEKYTKIHCDKEHCPTCGQKGSRLHKKRVTRATDRLIWTPLLGYLVFTLPEEVSRSKPDLDTLKHLSKKAWDITKQYFKTPGGVIRTHLMGEQLGKFHMHINVLFPILKADGRGVVDPKVLESVRADWTAFVNGFFDLKCETTNVHYKFATTDRQIIHKIKYVFRPIVGAFQFKTLCDDDRHYVLSLTGWHNTRWFGKLANCQYKAFLLEKGIEPNERENKDPYMSRSCPCCGGRFRFQEIVHKDDLPTTQLRWVDADTLVDFSIHSFLKEISP